MGTMNRKRAMCREAENLLKEIKVEGIPPAVVANRIGYFLSDAMRTGTINLYEGYLLHGEALRIRRAGGHWSGKVRIATCIAVMNQKLLSSFFQNKAAVKTYREWGLEAFHLCNEIREHYITDRYLEFMEEDISHDLLKYLL